MSDLIAGTGVHDRYARYDRATADLDPPLAVVDLAAFDSNASDLVRRSAGVPSRVVSKSLRCRHLIERALARPGYRGIMCYSLAEAIWLHSLGLSDDLLVAYPTADRAALRALAADESGRPLTRGPGVQIGTWRAPLRPPAEAALFAETVLRRPGFSLVGVLGYEGQIAGLGDAPPGRPVRAALVQAMQARSSAELNERRAEVVRRIRALPPLEFVNGGGTGSLESTSADKSVTELAAGSGLVGPTLFDAYAKFHPQPALLYALPVVRRPKAGVATVFSGGYVASGTGTPDRLPSPFWPAGLRLTKTEGAGEVQTPVLGTAADGLRIGDRVWMRHAKGGELGEPNAVSVPTYRGDGQCFG